MPKQFRTNSNKNSHPITPKKGIGSEKLNVKVKGNNDTIIVDPKTNNTNENKENTKKLTTMQKQVLSKLQDYMSILTESDVNYIKNSLNNSFQGSGSDNSFGRRLNDLVWNNEEHFRLTSEQNEKGITFLRKYDKKERWSENAYREHYVIENFKEFRLKGFKDEANIYQLKMGMHNYIPVYMAIANDGRTFEYYYYGGKVNITG